MVIFYFHCGLQESDLSQIQSRYERFKLHPILETDYDNGNVFWKFEFKENTTAPLFVESPEVPEDIVGISKISEMGILAIYTGIVFVIYGFFKTDYMGVSHEIMFESMDNCVGLLQLCDDIASARQNGDLILEEKLANELLEIYKSPETLIAYTHR